MLSFIGSSSLRATPLDFQKYVVATRHRGRPILKSTLQRDEILLADGVLRVSKPRDVCNLCLVATHNFGNDTALSSPLFPRYAGVVASATRVEFAVQNIPNGTGRLATIDHVRVVHSYGAISERFRVSRYNNGNTIVVKAEFFGGYLSAW